MRKQIAVLFSFFILISCFGLPRPAKAYVLTGPHILDLMVKKIGKARTLSITQNLTVFDDQEAAGQEFKESLKFMFPEYFRLDSVSMAAKRLYISSRGQVLDIQDGVMLENPAKWTDRYKDLLLVRHRAKLQTLLTEQGVDLSKTRLERFKDHICFVVGDGFSEAGGPELWVDKETFMPVRLVVSRGEAVLEIRYGNWQEVGRRFWYPMAIGFYRGQKAVGRIQVDRVDLKGVFDRDLFSIEKNKTIE